MTETPESQIEANKKILGSLMVVAAAESMPDGGLEDAAQSVLVAVFLRAVIAAQRARETWITEHSEEDVEHSVESVDAAASAWWWFWNARDEVSPSEVECGCSGAEPFRAYAAAVLALERISDLNCSINFINDDAIPFTGYGAEEVLKELEAHDNAKTPKGSEQP